MKPEYHLFSKFFLSKLTLRTYREMFIFCSLFFGIFISSALWAADTTSFITKWRTTNSNENIVIPINSSYTYNYDIDCDNDNIFEQIGVTTAGTCTYASAGEHIIKIRGTFPAIYINGGAMKNKLLDVIQWGIYCVAKYEPCFSGCK